MTSRLPPSPMELDKNVAQIINKQLNANKRRVSASVSPLQVPETPPPKRAKHVSGSASGIPPTSISLDHSYNNVRFNEASKISLPLSSNRDFEESSVNKGSDRILRSTSMRLKASDAEPASSCSIDTVVPSLSGRKQRGITDISISEADARSLPLPGPDLENMVDASRKRDKLPLFYPSSVIRLVDDKWMAPQMCTRCLYVSTNANQTRRQPKCDRKLSCSACNAVGSDCQPGKLMIVIGKFRCDLQLASLQRNASSTSQGPHVGLTTHVLQNANSTWSSLHLNIHIPQTTGQGVEIAPRPYLQFGNSPVKAGSLPSSEALSYASADIIGNHRESGADSAIASNANISHKADSKKRKADSDSEHAKAGEPAGQEAAAQTALTIPDAPKKKSAAPKKVGYVKYHQSVQNDKKPPHGNPPVWAEKRQNLCEALPYYKAYMSGAYLQESIVRAFMVDKEVGPRDKFEEEVMIARVGGGRKFDEVSGSMVFRTDQDKSAFALGFERAKHDKKPVVLIAGQGNKISPSKLPHYYNVLDWFHVTDVWCEKSEGYKCWMVRLEKVALTKKSWWAPIDSPPLDLSRDIYAIKTKCTRCNACNHISKEIYNAGWTCLVTSCRAFFDFGKDINEKQLDYNKAFLEERTEFQGVINDSLAPPLITDEDLEREGGFGVEKIYTSGIVCPLCKGCSRRVEWHRWTCETPACPFTHSVTLRTVKLRDAISDSLTWDRELCNTRFGIRASQKIIGLYNVYEFVVPGPELNEIAGVVRIFKANGVINAQRDGPNDLFYQMQVDDFGLKRHPSRQKGSTCEILTSHWAANWGAPYKYGVSVLTKGFDEAPPVIVKALKRLTWAGEQTVTEKLEPFHPFNELLSIGYFEDTQIGYHDDGEKELGPTVATLSLGGGAVMALRPKAKSNLGLASKNSKGTKSDVLRMNLQHGDLVVMHGSGIQKLYEHAVIPHGKLRFALTCRYVRPELMANDDERRQAEIKSKLPDGHEKYTYDGDISSQLMPIDKDPESVASAQAAMNDFAARAIAGEIDLPSLRGCRDLLNEIVDRLGVPNADGRSM